MAASGRYYYLAPDEAIYGIEVIKSDRYTSVQRGSNGAWPDARRVLSETSDSLAASEDPLGEE